MLHDQDMKIADLYRKHRPVISFEIFPPKTEAGLENLHRRLPRLIELEPSFISVTYGAMGSTRRKTLEIASLIKHEYGMETAHHLTCVGANRQEIDEILDQIEAQEIENIVALRGDPPRGESQFKAVEGGYSHACQLVDHIRSRDRFGIAVAGYPEKHLEAVDFPTDLGYLKKKVDAGADAVITQLFYENSFFWKFTDECRKLGIEKPLVAGLMPILSLGQIERITGMCGSSIPEDLHRALMEAEGDQEKECEVGIRHAVQQARELLEKGVQGLHFYVLNRCFHIEEIIRRLQAVDLRL